MSKQKLFIILKSIPLMILTGFFIQIVFSEFLELILSFKEGASEEYESIISPLLTMEPSMILRVGLIAPVLEELIFRGAIFFIFRRVIGKILYVIRKDSGKAPAYYGDPGDIREESGGRDTTELLLANTAQAIVFGLYHGNIYQAAYAFTIGLIFGFFVISFNSLLPGIIAHGSVNLSGLYMDRIFPQNTDGILRFVMFFVSLAGIIGVCVFVRNRALRE